MIKEVLIVMLHWVDPTTQVCAPLETQQSVERADEQAAKSKADMGKRHSGTPVDAFGILSEADKAAIERGARRISP